MRSSTLAGALVAALLASSANARLAAWYPLDESASDTGNTTAEFIEGNDAATIGYDIDPGFSLLTRGHPSARADLGTSYLLEKGSGFDLGGAMAVQPTDKFTITWWIQPVTFDPFDRILESLVGNDNGQDGLRIDTGGGGGNRLRCLVRDANGANNQNATNPLVMRNDGTWYFCAFRYDSAGIDNSPFQITVVEATGAPVDAAAIAAGTSGPATSSVGETHFPHASTSTFVGVENINAAPGNALNAALDEFAFFDNSDGQGILTDEQLAAVYNFGPSGVQLISNFATDSASVSPGNPATLSWEVNEPIDSLQLDDGVGNTTDVLPLTTAGEGSLVVTPTESTLYTLRATRGAAANASIVRILAGAAPAIDSFSTSASLIGNGSSADLSWTTTGADSITLDPGGTDVSALTTTTISPTETTTYTLSATNSFGTTTTDVLVQVIDGPVPTNRYVAATEGNTDGAWMDEVATSNWNMSGATLNTPPLAPSANTNISATYSTAGGNVGGATGSFQYSDFTGEVWLRPSGLTPDHQVVFESGGGQNGFGVLLTDTDFRFIGSIANGRTLDLTVPIGALNLADFVQLVFSTSAATDAFEVAIRDTFGNVVTASETANVLIGGNGAGLFIHASGALGGDNNLGGRTQLPDMTPTGLTGFTGEIAIVNIYDRLLDAGEIQTAFDRVATAVDPPLDTPFEITGYAFNAEANTVELSWDAINEHLYDAQISTDGENWTPLKDQVQATDEEANHTFTLPAGEQTLLIRIVDLGLD